MKETVMSLSLQSQWPLTVLVTASADVEFQFQPGLGAIVLTGRAEGLCEGLRVPEASVPPGGRLQWVCAGAHVDRVGDAPSSTGPGLSGQGQLQTAGCSSGSVCEWGSMTLLCPFPPPPALTWLTTSHLVPLWQDFWILWDMPANTFLAEEATAWRPWLWCFQEFLGGPCPEIEANCSQGTTSPRNGCIGSPKSHWRSPDGRPHSPPVVLGAGESSGTWRPPLPAT